MKDAHGMAKVVLLMAMLLGLPANATLVMHVPLKQMAREADVVVHARVGEQQVTWNKEHTRIFTYTRIEVLEAVKGAKRGDVLTIYQVGGSLDGTTFKIIGALQFTPGEEMVFCAKRFEDKIVSYGMGLGKFKVRAEHGRKWVDPSYSDVMFVKRDLSGKLVPDLTPPDPAKPLQQFLDELRALAAMGGER